MERKTTLRDERVLVQVVCYEFHIPKIQVAIETVLVGVVTVYESFGKIIRSNCCKRLSKTIFKIVKKQILNGKLETSC